MPETVFGLPVHPLLVHATVVTLPLAATLLIASVLVPRLRTWAGPLPLLLAVASLGLVPLTTMSGENLEKAIGTSQAINDHAALGEMVIWWAIGLVVVAAISYAIRLRGRTPATAVTVVVAILGVVAGVGTIVQVGLMGGGRIEVEAGLLLTKRVTWVGTVLRSRPPEEKIAISRRFAAEVLPLFTAGRLRPVIDRRFPLVDVADAHRHMEADANVGKILLDVRT
jgi:NADPH:quinone reductase-like Zn-dependent oxidoreductase